MSSAAGLWVVLSNPDRAYALAAEKRPVLWPALFLMLGFMIAGVLMQPAVEHLIRTELQAAAEMPPEAVDFALGIGRWWGLIGSSLAPLLWALVAAAVTALGLLFTPARAPFKALYSLFLFCSVPLLLKQLLLAGMVAAGWVLDLRQVLTSAALVLPAEAAGGMVFRLLNLVDPLELWFLALAAGGIRYLTSLKGASPWLIAGVIWLILIGGAKLAGVA